MSDSLFYVLKQILITVSKEDLCKQSAVGRERPEIPLCEDVRRNQRKGADGIGNGILGRPV